jgi:hypothetical protein
MYSFFALRSGHQSRMRDDWNSLRRLRLSHKTIRCDGKDDVYAGCELSSVFAKQLTVASSGSYNQNSFFAGEFAEPLINGSRSAPSAPGKKRLRPSAAAADATWHSSYSEAGQRPAVPGLRAPVVVEDLVYRNLIRRVHWRRQLAPLRRLGEADDHLLEARRRVAVERPA